jgi:hypothetical protein
MMTLQADLEKELLAEEPLPMTKKRGRKPGSKLKTLKSGTRVVVTGRAAQAILRSEKQKKEKTARKAAAKAKRAKTAKVKLRVKPKAKAGVVKEKRRPGRPRKVLDATGKPVAVAVKRQPRKRRTAKVRSGVIS